VGYRDPTPEELALLEGGPAKPRGRLRDPSPEELRMLTEGASSVGPWRDQFRAPAPAKVAETTPPAPAPVSAPAPTSGGDPFADAAAPSPAESAVRGWLSTATRGYSDEAAAGIDTLLGKMGLGPEVDYVTRREQYRARNRQAADENPKADLLGTGLGVVIAPKIPLPKGAGAATRGAAEGAAFGHGASERENASGQAFDTLAGAGAGAVIGKAADKLGKVIGGAPARIEQREIGNLTAGVPGGVSMKVLGKGGKNVPNIREAMRSVDDVRKLARTDPPAALAAAEKTLAPMSSRLDEIYDVAQTKTPGAPLQDVLAGLGEIKSRYSTTAEKPLAKAIDDLAVDLVEKFNNGPIPLKVLREEVAAWQRTGYAGTNVIERSAKKGFDIDVSNALRKALNDEVERVATKHPDLGIGAKELQETNKKVSTWLGITRLLEEKATRGPANAATLRDLAPKSIIREIGGNTASAAGEFIDPAIAWVGKNNTATRGLSGAYGVAAKTARAKAARSPADAYSKWKPSYSSPDDE